MAIKTYHIVVLTLLLSTGACESYFYHVRGYQFANFRGTPVERLAKAVQDEDVEQIGIYAQDNSMDIDYVEGRYNTTLLMLAVAHGKERSVEALLQYGANPNYADSIIDRTVVMVACFRFNLKYKCDTTVISHLLRYGGDINYRSVSKSQSPPLVASPLSTAIYSGMCLSFIKYLVEHGADVNFSPNNERGYILMSAIRSNRMDIVKYLIMEKKIALFDEYQYSAFNPRKYTLIELINLQKYTTASKNYRLQQEVLRYLKSQGYYR